MEMIKKEEKKDDGRYIIYYEFSEENGESKEKNKGKGKSDN